MAPERFMSIALLTAGVFLAGVLSCLAAMTQAQWAPVLIFPALLGVIFGGALLLLKRLWPEATRAAIVAAALIGSLVLITGQHYFAYRQYRANYEQSRAKNPQLLLVEEFKPMRLAEFLDYSARHRSYGIWQLHGSLAWASWGLDGVLVVTAAVGVVLAGCRRADPAKRQAADTIDGGA
jgi:hypothetical protein